MSFRRLPFQFTATDASERQREMRKRFGLPLSEEMYVDLPSSASMGAGARDSNSASSSPRLQHRVPIFMEGSEPSKSSVDSCAADGGRKPHVRVIPIEVEGERSPNVPRQRTYSGPAGYGDEANQYDSFQHKDPVSPIKRPMHDLTMPGKLKSPNGPRVCNIPITIEGKNETKENNVEVSQSTSINKAVKNNASHVSRRMESDVPKDEKSEPDISIPLKKVDVILSEFKSYETAVDNFSGTAKDKQYRFLDEMLTRCMLKLDDIDTMGNETVRMVRKAAVKKVQACIDLLESKINTVIEGKVETEVIKRGDIKSEDAKAKELTPESSVASDVNMDEKTDKEGSVQNPVECANEKSELQVETNDVDMVECEINVLDKTENKALNGMKLANSSYSKDDQEKMESENVSDMEELSASQIECGSQEKDKNATAKNIKVSSLAHLEPTAMEMTEEREATEIFLKYGVSEKNQNKLSPIENSDVYMSDVSLPADQNKILDLFTPTQEKVINGIIDEHSSSNAFTVGEAVAVNGICPELNDKICDNCAVPNSECGTSTSNSCEIK